ncbi:MAG: Lrp/AsnC family transcriptional regulator [Desulfobacterales bacterium]|jgi:Lrp/AsnC family leucine-responsive transcriptional regulator|nr:Lrp/AsnC family transcriptional regulator [Desulfobacterales bacterium]
MIDEISFQILKILQEKARIPNVEVARLVGMAPSAVLERIRKLEKQGFIDGYEVRLNPDLLGRSLVAFVFVRVAPGPAAISYSERFSEIPEVQEVHYIAGRDGFLLKVRVADHRTLAALIQNRIGAMAGVEKTQTHMVLETFKETSRIPLDALQPAQT